MLCMHCGEELPPDAFFCPNCGRKVEAESAAYGADYASVQTDRTDGGPGEAIDSCMNFSIIIMILTSMGCGAPFNIVLGILAFLHASSVDRHLQSGSIAQAKSCAHTAKILCWIAVGIIAVQVLIMSFIVFIVFLANFLAASME